MLRMLKDLIGKKTHFFACRDMIFIKYAKILVQYCNQGLITVTLILDFYERGISMEDFTTFICYSLKTTMKKVEKHITQRFNRYGIN